MGFNIEVISKFKSAYKSNWRSLNSDNLLNTITALSHKLCALTSTIMVVYCFLAHWH